MPKTLNSIYKTENAGTDFPRYRDSGVYPTYDESPLYLGMFWKLYSEAVGETCMRTTEPWASIREG